MVKNDIYIGAPAIINRQGVKQVIEIPLTDAEQEKNGSFCFCIKKKLLKQLFAKFEAEEAKITPSIIVEN